MAAFVLARPIFTSALVADELGVTRRTALNLIAELEGQGLVRNLLPRRAARFWATASLAERLRVDPRRAKAGRPALQPSAGVAPPRPEAGSDEVPALAALDRAIAAADQILRGLSGRNARR